MSQRIEDYALIGDLHTAALGRAGRFRRLAVPAPLRLAVLLLPPAGHGGARVLAPGSGRRGQGDRGHPALVPPRHARARDRVRHAHGDGPHHRLHAGARRAPAPRPLRRGRERQRRHADGPHRALRLRRGGALGHHPRRVDPPDGRARLARLVAPGGGGGQGPELRRRVHRDRGPALSLHAGLVPVARGAAAAPRQLLRRPPDRGLLVRVGRALLLHRPLQRRRRALAHHAQGAHLRADRRHRRRADHVAPRGARRQPQLGLPLLLAARRHPHPRVAHAGRLLHRGHGLARLVAADGGGRRVQAADHVRRRRRAPAR